MHIIDFLDRLESPDQRARGEGALSSASIVYNFRVLRSIFGKALDWKVIKENPMRGVQQPKETRPELDVYGEAEVVDLMKALETERPFLRSLIMLAVTTGMRRGELLGLEWKHIDLEQGIIDVRQSIPMFKDGEPVIKEPKTRNSQRKINRHPSICGGGVAIIP